MNAVEIDSSFYRSHRRATYERWARSTPEDFRFSVKVPKGISHTAEFDPAIVDQFVGEVVGLEPKLAILLVQLPPKAAFHAGRAARLFDAIASRTSVQLVCEPRHPTWFRDKPERWLADRRIARVAADPPRANDADQPGGWQGLRYFRLHGSPRVYYSNYGDEALAKIGEQLSSALASSDTWCIFDNTALGAAMENALRLKAGDFWKGEPNHG
jgi:uncharacterized protein YecE (DUF72 family)